MVGDIYIGRSLLRGIYTSGEAKTEEKGISQEGML